MISRIGRVKSLGYVDRAQVGIWTLCGEHMFIMAREGWLSQGKFDIDGGIV